MTISPAKTINNFLYTVFMTRTMNQRERDNLPQKANYFARGIDQLKIAPP